jgi:opacity protein-like surface antigen
MVRKKTVRSLLALAVLWLAAGVAQARDIKFDVYVLGGGSTFVDAEYFLSADHLYHSRFELGPKFNIGVAVPYGKLLSIEMGYSAGTNNLVITDTNVFPHVGRTYPVRDYIGNLSAVFHAPFSFKHVVPYAAAGAEYDKFSPTPAAITLAKNQGFGPVSTATINGNNKVGINLGGGLDRKIMKRLTLRVDVRDHITSSPAFGLPPFSDSGAAFPVSRRAHNIQYTAGIVFHLGKL